MLRSRLPLRVTRSFQTAPIKRSLGPIRYATTSPPPLEKTASFLQRHKVIKWTIYGAGSIVFGLVATTGIILVYDAMTYREAHVGNVPVAPLALHPNPGGPKNLPILSHFVEGSAESTTDGSSKDEKLSRKERLVIVGGGWAAVALLNSLDPDEYDVTMIAPNNFFLL